MIFANAFAAYATAFSLSTGASKLVSVQIRFFLQGNTITGKANLGYAYQLGSPELAVVQVPPKSMDLETPLLAAPE